MPARQRPADYDTAMTAHVLEQFADNIAQHGMDNVLRFTKPADLGSHIARVFCAWRL